MVILIDRGQVMTDYLENLGRKDGYKAKYEALSKAVDEAPAVDAAPVVHGRWEIGGMDGDLVGNWICSVCDGVSLDDSNYCPNCGAKMDD